MQSKHIVLADTFRRLFSIIIDVAIVFFGAAMLFSYIAVPIVNQYYQGNELADQAYDIQISSGLFQGGEDSGGVIAYSEEEYPKAIYTYYVTSGLASTDYSSENYYINFLNKNAENTLFNWYVDIPDNEPWKVSYPDDKEAEVNALYKDLYQKAIDDLEINPTYSDLNNKLSNRQGAAHLISLVPMVLVVYILAPLLFKNGATLGEWSLGIAHANSLGYRMDKGQIVFRGLSFILINYIGLFLGGPIVSFAMAAIRKDRRSLTDLLALSITIDRRESLIFNDVNEEERFDKKIATQAKINADQIAQAKKEIEEERNR